MSSAFHATSMESAERILKKGFRLDVPHVSDPGDFGLGIYFTTNIHRARAIGRVILEVELRLVNPLRLSQKEAYRLVIDELGFDTIHGHGCPEKRAEEARKAREWFLEHGHDALISVRSSKDFEIAVYSLVSIGTARKI